MSPNVSLIVTVQVPVKFDLLVFFIANRQKIMDVLLNGLSISAKGELQSLCCMIGKMMSLRCHFLAANGWRLMD